MVNNFVASGLASVIVLPEILGLSIAIADVLTLLFIMAIGRKLKSWPILVLAAAQLLLVLWFEFSHEATGAANTLYVDNLAIIMMLLIDGVGPLIAIFAVPYMAEHEHHLQLRASRQPRFFAVIAVFLVAMNGLVLANNLLWMYFFWEVTTLCSYLLIAHDGNETAVNNAKTALIINSFGGLALITGIILIYEQTQTLELTVLLANGSVPLVLLPLAWLILAALTKSAQFPFQSWLLGAMVAPTPVSALLHSSTMVKAGVYLVLRLAPLYLGTWLAKVITIIGAFTFAVGAFEAIAQTNAKRILAFSTISNLGLIIALAGISHIYAVYAALLLIVLHGVSKALLFMCVGAIEQTVGSRDVEAMDGIRTVMPLTAKLTITGALSMLVPPFGVLITKWIGIEVSTANPVAMLLIIAGSAFTVMFWAKFLGKLLSKDSTKSVREQFNFLLHGPLVVLAVLVVAVSVLIVPFSDYLVTPYVHLAYAQQHRTGWMAAEWDNSVSQFLGWDLGLVVLVVLAVSLLARLFYSWFKPHRYVQPYLAGENGHSAGTFVTAGDTVCKVTFKNYYLGRLVNEQRTMVVADVIAGALIIIMFGVML